MTKIKELMSVRIVSIAKTASLGSVLSLMKSSRVSLLPVLDGSTLFGIIEEKEAEHEIERWGEEKKVGELRLRRFFVETSDDVGAAARIMVANRISRLPVVDTASAMRFVGIVSSSDIARKHEKKLL